MKYKTLPHYTGTSWVKSGWDCLVPCVLFVLTHFIILAWIKLNKIKTKLAGYIPHGMQV